MRLHATIGDGPTVRRLQLVDGTNTAVDLTDVQTVVWTAVGRTSARTITGSATVVTAASGIITLTLTAAHLDPADTPDPAIAEVYELHTVATWADAVETFPTPGADELRLDPR